MNEIVEIHTADFLDSTKVTSDGYSRLLRRRWFVHRVILASEGIPTDIYQGDRGPPQRTAVNDGSAELDYPDEPEQRARHMMGARIEDEKCPSTWQPWTLQVARRGQGQAASSVQGHVGGDLERPCQGLF